MYIPEVLPEALEVARNIEDDSARAKALSKLTSRIPSLLPEALEAVRNIHPR